MNLAHRIKRRVAEESAVLAARLENHIRPFASVSLVTAANDTYFVPLKRMLKNAFRHEHKYAARIMVYDLGLTLDQVEYLRRTYPSLIIRRFDLASELPWASMETNAGGFYAWKPMIISRVFNEFDTDVIWLDSSIVIRRPLFRVRKAMRRTGLYTSYWIGKTIRDATDEHTIISLAAENESCLPMLVASVVGVARSSSVAELLLKEWVKYSADPSVNNPLGATIATHKGDQSILSVLAYRYGLACKLPHRSHSERLDFFIQNDRKTMFIDQDNSDAK
jgi:hypothetical protein